MSDESLPAVTLIVLNYNGRFLLNACLTALLNLDYPHFEVILVDNASNDDSISFVKQHFPRVAIILNNDNRGYAAGNNAALRQVQTPFAILVNPDIVVKPDWLRQFIIPMLTDARIGIAGCKLVYPDGVTLQHAGGVIRPPRAAPDHFGARQPDTGQFDALQDVEYVIGAALAVRLETITAIGLLDEGFFLYFEDADWCTRARRAGWRVVYLPQATAVHDESAIAGQEGRDYLRRFHTSRWRYLLKHTDPQFLLDATCPAEADWLAQCGVVERQAAVQAYRLTLNTLPEIFKRRAEDGGVEVTVAAQNQIAQSLLDLRRLALLSAYESLNPASLAGSAVVAERPFSSQTPLIGPLIARFRSAWNNVAARWYVRPLTAQQNAFNQEIVNELTLSAERLRDQGAIILAQESDQVHVQQRQADLRVELAQLEQQLTQLSTRLQQLEEKYDNHTAL